MLIKEQFLESVSAYTTDHRQPLSLWSEIEKSYSGAKRHYHNLVHLENLTSELLSIREEFEHWDTVVFSIAYHDAVYNTLKRDNEEKSAGLAMKRLSEINVPAKDIEACKNYILATKLHGVHSEEINLFTDADLSILGASPEAYAVYSKQIRLEYAWYPDIVYNPGREKVLLHFLSMENIFKTKHFRDRYETTARMNIQDELDRL